MTLVSNNDQRTAVGSLEVEQAPSTVRKSGGSVGHVLISGIGFLADAYDLFVIDFVLAILLATSAASPSAGDKSIVVSATHAGAVIGQLCFGIGADFIGRRVMFICTAGLVIIGSLASAFVGWGYRSSVLGFSVFNQLALCRFFLGIGIGGEYPLSATVASESESFDELERSAAAALYGEEVKVGHQPVITLSFDIIGFWGCVPVNIAPTLFNLLFTLFPLQGLGMILSPLFVMVCISAGMSLETTWRLCLAVGAIPSAIAFFFRWRMTETAAFSKSKRDYSMAESFSTTDGSSTARQSKTDFSPVRTNNDVATIAANTTPAVVASNQKKATWSEFGKHLNRSWAILKQFRWVLLGTSSTWFLIDVTLYGTGSFKSAVVGEWFQSATITSAPTTTFKAAPASVALAADVSDVFSGYDRRELKRPLEFTPSVNNFQRSTLLRLLSSASPTRALNDEEAKSTIRVQAEMASYVALLAIPGYVLSFLLIHKTGQRPLQFWGFLAVATVYVLIGGVELFAAKVPIVTLILFGLSFLCSNFGPNTTTFIMPTQLYPTVVRATCHGFSAAMGKAGAVVGSSLFSVVEGGIGLGWLLILCGGVAVCGAACTLIIPNDKKARVKLLEQEIEFAAKAKKRRMESRGVPAVTV